MCSQSTKNFYDKLKYCIVLAASPSQPNGKILKQTKLWLSRNFPLNQRKYSKTYSNEVIAAILGKSVENQVK